MGDTGPRSPRGQRDDLDPRINAKLDQFFTDGLCSVSDIDGKIRHQLQVISPSDALDALEKLESALRTSTVRNLSAYLAGVIRRITQTPSDPETPIQPLVPEAQSVLEHLYGLGLVRRGDLDSKSLAALANRAPEMQVLVMETFRDRNLHGIRNMAAFFTSHQTQVEKDLRDGKLRLPRLGPPPSRGNNRGYGPPPTSEPYDPAYRPIPVERREGPPPGSYGEGPPQDYRQPPPFSRGPPQQAPPGAYGAPPPAAARAPTPPKDYAVEQGQWGIRVDEFQNLSSFAKFVHPAAALRLQQLWDVEQNKLVSVLNEASWESIAGLDAANGVAAINECAETMKTAPDDLDTINSIFITVAAKFPKRPDAPTLATIALAAATAKLGGAAQLASIAPGQPSAYLQPPAGVGAPPPAYGGAPPSAAYGPPPGGALAPVYGGPPPGQYGAPPPGAGPGPSLPPGGRGGYDRRPPPRSIELPGPVGTLPPAVRLSIDGILRKWGGLLKLDHFQGKPVDLLHEIGERNALLALDEFGRNDPGHMRSPTAYLIGCLKKFDIPEGARGGHGGGGRGSPRGGGGRRGGGRGGRHGARSPPRSSRYEPY